MLSWARVRRVKHPEIPRLANPFDLLQRDRVADHLAPVVTERARDLWSAPVVAGHGSELADLRVDHREQVPDVGSKDRSVFIENVVRAGAETDRGRDVPLVIAQNDISCGPDDERRVEPAVGKLRHLLDDAAAGNVELVLARLVGQPLNLRSVERDRLLHEAVDAVLALAGRRDPLQEVFGEHDQAGRQLPEIADAEVDQIADALEVLTNAVSILGHDDMRLHDERGVLFDSRCHVGVSEVLLSFELSAYRSDDSLKPRSSSITCAVIVPIAEMPPPGWHDGPVM